MLNGDLIDTIPENTERDKVDGGLYYPNPITVSMGKEFLKNAGKAFLKGKINFKMPLAVMDKNSLLDYVS